MISIIVPVYNVADYLRQCLESLIGQTYKNIEIILVDDGSTDDCPRICDEYAQIDNRIVAIHKTNGGLVSARKVGMAAAHGEYIGYVDGDDWIEPEMYEKLLSYLTDYHVDIAMCGRYEDTAGFSKKVFHGIDAGRYDKDSMLRDVYPRMLVNNVFFEWGIFPGVWDKLFRKECVEPHQMRVREEIRMGEDAVCVYPCMLTAGSIYVLDECLYHYRQTVNSMVKKVQDYEAERRQFCVLYQSGLELFTRLSPIYDVREQWKEYVLFLMLPRSDGLYRGYDQLDYLFPFPNVKKGMHIVLYGAGTYGQRLYQYLKRTNFCDVVLWADQNAAELQKFGLDVDSPHRMKEESFQQIVVAITYDTPRKAVYQELTEKYGKEKVSVIDERLIKSEKALESFGL